MAQFAQVSPFLPGSLLQAIFPACIPARKACSDSSRTSQAEERTKTRRIPSPCEKSAGSKTATAKTAGAKAAQGASLDEVVAVAQKAIANTRSVGVGLTPCTIPAVGKPNFLIEDGKMELGIGHHGEPGVEVSDLKTADEIAALMLDIILPDLPFTKGDEVAAIVSGLGATPIMECYILFNRAFDILEEKGIKIHRSYVGNYFTSLDMMGVTITLMRLDDELKQLVDTEADSMGLRQF